MMPLKQFVAGMAVTLFVCAVLLFGYEWLIPAGLLFAASVRRGAGSGDFIPLKIVRGLIRYAYFMLGVATITTLAALFVFRVQ